MTHQECPLLGHVTGYRLPLEWSYGQGSFDEVISAQLQLRWSWKGMTEKDIQPIANLAAGVEVLKRDLDRVVHSFIIFPNHTPWISIYYYCLVWILSSIGVGKYVWSHYCVTSDQIRSVAQSCPTLCDPMNHSTPVLPVHHQLPEFTETHVHRVSDAIQPSHPLSSPCPPAPNPSQHHSLFQWVNSSYEVAKVLEFQL